MHITATDWNGHTFAVDAPPIVRVGAGAFTPVKPSTDDDSGTAPLVVANRASLTWPDGATAPDPAVVASLAATPAPLLLELDALTPATPAFAQYAAALAQQLPNLAYLTIGPAPTAATAAQYVATVSAVRDAVHALVPTTAVGMVVDGAAAPKQTVAALGKAGAIADVLAFRAAPTVATGAWTQPNITSLTNAFAGTLPPLLLDTPSRPRRHRWPLRREPSPALRSIPTAPDAARPRRSQRSRAEPSSAQAWPRLRRRPSSTPTGVTSGTPATLQLACARDCLYVATLVGGDGRAVVATRGSLTGGAAANDGHAAEDPARPGRATRSTCASSAP